jgi:mannose-6-phosphate isomerase-like protein (cupin superfamily)
MKTAGPARPRSASVSFGAALTFESFGEGEDAPLRMHPREETLLRVIDGTVSLTIHGRDELLAVGHEVRIAAGVAHRLAAASGDAHVMIGLRAA